MREFHLRKGERVSPSSNILSFAARGQAGKGRIKPEKEGEAFNLR